MQPPNNHSADEQQHGAVVEPQLDVTKAPLEWVEQNTGERNEDMEGAVESGDKQWEECGLSEEPNDSAPQNFRKPIVGDLLDYTDAPVEGGGQVATGQDVAPRPHLEMTEDLLDFSITEDKMPTTKNQEERPQSTANSQVNIPSASVVTRENSLLESCPVPAAREEEVAKRIEHHQFDVLDYVDMSAEPMTESASIHAQNSPRRGMEKLTRKIDHDADSGNNSMITDPCGMASETLENIGSFISQGSGGAENNEDVERDAICSVVSNSEHQERISEVVASFSSTMAAVGLSHDNDGACSPCHDDYDIDLRGDDDEFQLLARRAVAFLRSRLDEDKFTITIKPTDREMARDIIPTGIRSQFFDALRYRLSVAPKSPSSSLDFLVFECQELGLDVEGEKNPMLAAVSVLDEPLSFDVLHILENKQSFDFGNLSRPDTGGISKASKSGEEIEPASAQHVETIPLASSPNVVNTDFDVDGGSKDGDGRNTLATPISPPISHTGKASPYQDKHLTPMKYTEDYQPPRAAVDTALGSMSPEDNKGDVAGAMETVDEAVSAEVSESVKAGSLEAYKSSTSEAQTAALDSTDRSFSSTKRDRAPAESEKTLAPKATSAFVSSGNASQTDTENTPYAVGVMNPFVSRTLPVNQRGPQSPYFAKGGLPSDISHESRPTSAISGLESSPVSPDPGSDYAVLHRLQAEIQEAERLADAAEKPDTKAFWTSHAEDLQNRLDSLERSASCATSNQQNIAENPVGRPKFSPDASTPHAGDYYAMDEENPYQQHNTKNAQSQHMQALEYESRMVDVIAPADLPGGYHFEAEIEGQRFLATVPAGGVQQGETFTCYMRELNSVAIDIPVGHWKDNMCHMCKHGLCHPTLWHGLCCPLSKS